MNFLPIHWPPGSALDLFEALVGPGKCFPMKRWGNELDNLLPEGDELYKFLSDLNETNSRILLGRTGKEISNWKFEVSRSDPNMGPKPVTWRFFVLGRVPALSRNIVDHFDNVLSAARVVGCHIVHFDLRHSNYATFSEKQNFAMAKTIKSTVHEEATFGDWRGLSCVSWRLALGSYYIDMFGEERLERLPQELGYRHSSGYWVLQTCENPEDSLDEQARSNEQKIIDILGQEFFFNKETGELPQVVPAFPLELIPSDQALIDEYGPMLAD